MGQVPESCQPADHPIHHWGECTQAAHTFLNPCCLHTFLAVSVERKGRLQDSMSHYICPAQFARIADVWVSQGWSVDAARRHCFQPSKPTQLLRVVHCPGYGQAWAWGGLGMLAGLRLCSDFCPMGGAGRADLQPFPALLRACAGSLLRPASHRPCGCPGRAPAKEGQFWPCAFHCDGGALGRVLLQAGSAVSGDRPVMPRCCQAHTQQQTFSIIH